MPSGPKGGNRPTFWGKEGWRKPEKTEDGREFHRLEVEGKKPSLN